MISKCEKSAKPMVLSAVNCRESSSIAEISPAQQSSAGLSNAERTKPIGRTV
jgi:hypothetical protein